MSEGRDRLHRRRLVAEPTRAWVVAGVAIAAVLFPLTRDRGADSFPLSNYPMFTAERPATTSFVRAVGIAERQREEITLPPALAGGTVEVIHAARTLRLAIAEGRADSMCAEIATRVATARADIVEVLIVTERYDVVDALRADDPAPLAREVHARCPVPRP